MSDTDADAWAAAIVSGGGSVTAAQDYATQNLCVGLKADGVYSKLTYLLPLYTDSLSAALSIDIIARVAVTQVGTPTYASKDGVTFNGTDQAFNLGTTGGTSQDSAAFGFDIATTKTDSNTVEMGASVSAGTSYNCSLSVAWSDGLCYFALNDANGDGGRSPPGTRIGVYINSRTGSTLATLYKDGSSFATNGQTSTAVPTVNYHLAASLNASSVLNYFSPAKFCMCFIGTGLTATDASNLTTRWNTYKADLLSGPPSGATVVLDAVVIAGTGTVSAVVVAPDPPIAGVEYFDTFPPFGSPGGPDDPWVIGVGADPLALDAHLGKDLLLIAEPLESGVEGSMDMDLFPPFGSLPDGWSSSGDEARTLYIAATTGRSTANDDEPPAQYVPGKLMPYNFGARLFEGLDPSSRSANRGVIALIDPDGGLDDLIGRVWDGTPITLKRGARGTPFKTWPVVGNFRSAGLVRDLDSKQIQLSNLGWLLEGSLHDETYAGTGDVEGVGDNIVGRKKPWALGYCFNIDPVLLSASDQIFQWSKTSSQELEELRHGGVIFPVNADYPTYAALAAATIPPGECATCLAKSLVRPNVDLAFGVRVDVIGDADVVNGHPAPLTRAAIARRIVTSSGENQLDDNSEIDISSFSRMEAYHPAPVGWFFDGDFTKAAALDRILAGVLGYWRVRPDGRLAIGWLERPESKAATVTITGGKDDVGKPRLVATAAPRRGTRVAWRWNHAPQPDRSSLAGAVSDADAWLYKRPASYGQSLDPAVASTWPTATLVTVDFAGYRDESDAVAEAARQQSVFSIVRNRWARDLQIDPFIDLLGEPVRITDDPLQAGGDSTQLCVAIESTGSSVQTVEFFN